MPAASPREQPQPSARHTSSLWMALTAPTRPHCPKKGLALENLKFPFSRTDALPLTTDQFEQKPLAKQPDAGQDNFGEEWVLLLPCWPQGTRRPCRGPLVLQEARLSLPAQGGVDAGWVLCSLQGTLIPANATHSIPDPSQQKLAPGTGQKENTYNQGKRR